MEPLDPCRRRLCAFHEHRTQQLALSTAYAQLALSTAYQFNQSQEVDVNVLRSALQLCKGAATKEFAKQLMFTSDAVVAGVVVDELGLQSAVEGFYAAHGHSYVFHRSVLEVLLRRGLDVNDKKSPALCRAIAPSMVKLLLEHDADPWLETARVASPRGFHGGGTPLYRIASNMDGWHTHHYTAQFIKVCDMLVAAMRQKPGPLCGTTDLLTHSQVWMGCVACGHESCLQVLFDARVFVHEDVSLLSLLARFGWCEMLTAAVEAGAFVDGRDVRGSTPLMHAILWNQVPCVEQLLALGADVRLVDSQSQRTVLHAAAGLQDTRCLQLLLPLVEDIDAMDQSGYTPLHTAAALRNSPHCTRLLLDAGADANKRRCDNSATPLHQACLAGHVECARLLLEAGANWTMLYTRNEMHRAVSRGHTQVVQLLIEYGLKPGDDMFYRLIRPPVQLVQLLLQHVTCPQDALNAILSQPRTSPDVMAALLDAGVDPNVHELVSSTSSPDHVRLLLEAGADVAKRMDAHDCRDVTLLHSLASNADMVAMLLQRGADVHARDERGRTPLHYAASNADSVTLMLAAGAEVDAVDTHGRTPLFLSSSAATRVLLRHGANVFHVDHKGNSVLWRDHLDVDGGEQLDVLLQHGALLDARNSKGHTCFKESVEAAYSVEMLMRYGIRLTFTRRGVAEEMKLVNRYWCSEAVLCGLYHVWKSHDCAAQLLSAAMPPHPVDLVLRFTFRYPPTGRVWQNLLADTLECIDRREDPDVSY